MWHRNIVTESNVWLLYKEDINRRYRMTSLLMLDSFLFNPGASCWWAADTEASTWKKWTLSTTCLLSKLILCLKSLLNMDRHLHLVVIITSYSLNLLWRICLVMFSLLSTKDQNQQWIDSQYCLCSQSLIHLIPLLKTVPNKRTFYSCLSNVL